MDGSSCSPRSNPSRGRDTVPYGRVIDQLRIEQDGDDALVWVKAVPGASRDVIAGVLGDRLKVRVGAPPEGGKANKAVCALLARALGVKPRDVSIRSGRSSPEKIVRIEGADADALRGRLGGGGG